jgi:copper chaperone
MASKAQLTYSVPGASCGHCVSAIETEVAQVAGVDSVEVDLSTKLVTVRGDVIDAGDVTRAIDEAGYDAEPA